VSKPITQSSEKTTESKYTQSLIQRVNKQGALSVL